MMKPRDHDLERRSQPADLGPPEQGAAPIARVVMVAPPERAAARPEPLQIEYTVTRRLPDALVRLQRNVGIVKPERSELAEAYKMLRNQVLHRMRADGHRVLAVTSPRAMEGKSLAAVNLALTVAADFDSAVLLIDGDLAQHGTQRLFGLEGRAGLADYLLHDQPLSDLLVNPGVERLTILPAGAQAQPSSAELLATRAAQHLMQEVKARYGDRWIVVDLPPLLDTADALAFLPYVDTTLVVVEDHVTTQADLEAATQLLAPFNLVGSVISKGRAGPGAARTGDRGDPGVKPWHRRWWRRSGN